MPTARVQEADCSRFVPRLALVFPLRAFSDCIVVARSYLLVLTKFIQLPFIHSFWFVFSLFSFLRFLALVRHVYARSSACAGRSGCFSFSTRRAFLLILVTLRLHHNNGYIKKKQCWGSAWLRCGLPPVVGKILNDSSSDFV